MDSTQIASNVVSVSRLQLLVEAVQEHRQKIGRTNHTLLLDIKSDYGLETPYQGLERSFTGYVANVTETCDPENALPLITQVQVAAQPCGLAEALPDLKERTGVKTMLTDGGYGGILSDAALQEQGVKLIQTAIRGLQPNPNQFHLADFELCEEEQGHPTGLD